MSYQPEIACYADPECKGSIEASIDLLREHGYNVKIADDVGALHQWLEDRVPAAIVYTLVSDSASWGKSFQSIASKAVEQSIPMMLIGPDDFAKGFTLYYPMDPLIDGKQVERSMLVAVLDEIHGTTHAVPSGGAPSELPSQNTLVDSFDAGEDSVKIETLVTQDAEPKITTLVYRYGEVVVREEQAVGADDPDFADKMEVQHIAALESYAPASPSARRKVAAEVSGPIAVEKEIREATPKTMLKDDGRSPIFRPVLILGIIVLCGVVFYLSTKQVTPLPRPVSRPQTVPIPSAHGIGDNTDPKRAEPAQAGAGALQDDVEADLRHMEDDDGNSILFPGRFRPNQTAFGFRNRKEEQQFVAAIAELAPKKKIRLVVRYRDRSISGDKRRLGMARANAVLRYLREQGIEKRKLAVDVAVGLQAVGRSHSSSARVIIDQ